jgi:ABC-2 type transport system ATP-binding protein
MLEFVGLAGRGGDKIGGFSHGMKQRLGIAQTLLHNPDVIILDEESKASITSYISRINELFSA